MDTQTLRILIIEDNPDIAENIADFLEHEGHVIDFAMDGITGLHLAVTEDYDVIVLDLMLPGMDGITVCKKLRQEANRRTPVLMLTARDTLPNKLEGFTAGADDYLVKPFEPEEMLARIKAISRRNNADQNDIHKIEDLIVDTGKMMVRRSGQEIALNPTCLNILICMVKAYPNIIKKKDLEFNIWSDSPPDSDTLKSHIYTLRNKVDKPFSNPLIHTIHGIGYRIGNQLEKKC